jgi:hypothetical protein
MNKRNIYILGVISILTFSCKKDKAFEPVCTDEISFSQDVQPIIMNSCATTGCHSGPNASNNMNFTSYENVFEHRILIGKSVRGESGVTQMPIGPALSADQINKISCWIEQGALNN